MLAHGNQVIETLQTDAKEHSWRLCHSSGHRTCPCDTLHMSGTRACPVSTPNTKGQEPTERVTREKSCKKLVEDHPIGGYRQREGIGLLESKAPSLSLPDSHVGQRRAGRNKPSERPHFYARSPQKVQWFALPASFFVKASQRVKKMV